ncbi:hypothetical protein Tco_0489397 [Tanacetum coccineum]
MATKTLTTENSSGRSLSVFSYPKSPFQLFAASGQEIFTAEPQDGSALVEVGSLPSHMLPMLGGAFSLIDYGRLRLLLESTLTFFPEVPCSVLTLSGLVTGDCLSCSGACSARMCVGYDPCGAAEFILLADVCGLILYVIMPPSLVRVKDVTRLRSARLLAVSGLACGSSQLFISLYLHRPMKGVDTCLDLSICGFLFRRSCTFSHRLGSLLLVFAFKMVGSSIYTVTSVLTQRELDLHCATFNIPVELRPKLPDRNSTIKDSQEGKIGMWLSFSKRGGVDDPCCYSKKFDSLKNWNNRFFWIDASVCLLSTPWFNGTSVVKDPLPLDEAVDLPWVELLNDNRTLIRKYPETFLCLVGLSRSFIKTGVRPTLLYDNDEEIGLLDFVKYVDPFKVKVRERTLADNEDELNVNSGKQKQRVAFVSGSPPVKKARAEGIVISDSRPSMADKSPSDLRRLSRQNKEADTGSGSTALATKDVTSFSVTPTPERVLEDVSDDNVRTCPPSGHFVILSYVTADTDLPDSPQVVPPATSATTGVNAPVGDGRRLSGSGPEAGALSATPSQGSSADDFYESQTIDSASALNVYAALRNQHDAAFLDVVNINSAQHVCMVSELRLHYEHEIMTSEKFKKKFTDSVAVVQQRDAEIAILKAWLEKSEAEAAKVIELRKYVSDLEVTVAIKVGELANLHTKNVGLVERVSALESERDSLKNQVVGEGKMREEFVSQQDATKRRFAKCAAELDARIADVRRDMDNDLYPHMLTAIAGRRWVVGHGFRLAVYKCARSVECRSALGKVEAYDLEVEGKYVATVSEFEGVSFPLLDELEGLKDSPLALIMYALTLKDGQGNKDATPEFAWFQPSIDLVYVPVYSESGSVDREMLLSDVIPAIRQSAERRGLCPPSSSASGGTSGPAPSYDSSLGVTDYHVSTLVLASDGGSAN